MKHTVALVNSPVPPFRPIAVTLTLESPAEAHAVERLFNDAPCIPYKVWHALNEVLIAQKVPRAD